eukprot:CAMPEP_0182917672 /NCGR_PEP_ID=MMETSP0105_2-20130417/1647_1 /TAXON_ID=81532 ORGANISM="Acanthoeca-like sp., Strain 10tr" /NCGR_SAMPLE_ID=MMETSP0105_2 /ASSEMBLY_ACC=CAM_ASM_000205 /LENGTH=622 /DNA_ID=CAMNT_0025054687 /DNA_START=52 /DNA_END=1920 /DNA_ORIENTATION=+
MAAVHPFVHLVRLLVALGFVILLAASPISLRELGRFGCTTTQYTNFGFEETLYGEGWTGGVISIGGIFAVLVVGSTAGAVSPVGLRHMCAALVVSVLPVVWAAVMMLRVAMPVCPDEALLHDRDTVETLANGDPALTTRDTLVDDTAQAMAAATLLIGAGGVLLCFRLALRQISRDGSLSATHTIVMGLTMALLGAGAYPLYQKADDGSKWQWSDDGNMSAALSTQCTQGSSAIFGHPIAARNRGAFNDISIISFFVTVGALSFCVVVALVAAVAPPRGGLAMLYFGCATVFATALGFGTKLVSEAVYIGANPRCSASLLATDKHEGLGLFAMALATTFYAMFALFTSRAIPAGRAPPAEPEKVEPMVVPANDTPAPPPPPPPPRATRRSERYTTQWTGQADTEGSSDEDDYGSEIHHQLSPRRVFTLPEPLHMDSTVDFVVEPSQQPEAFEPPSPVKVSRTGFPTSSDWAAPPPPTVAAARYEPEWDNSMFVDEPEYTPPPQQHPPPIPPPRWVGVTHESTSQAVGSPQPVPRRISFDAEGETPDLSRQVKRRSSAQPFQYAPSAEVLGSPKMPRIPTPPPLPAALSRGVSAPSRPAVNLENALYFRPDSHGHAGYVTADV